MVKNEIITAEELRSILNYDPKTGKFTYSAKCARNNIGDEAGWKNGNGYLKITVNQIKYYAHRLAWLYVTGNWPMLTVDHKNGVGIDNCWSNLRLASHSENGMNKAAKKIYRNGTIRKGVYFHKQASKWAAQIAKDGKVSYLGLFGSAEDAHAAYVAAAGKLHGEFARMA
jgi:hypothetical protein